MQSVKETLERVTGCAVTVSSAQVPEQVSEDVTADAITDSIIDYIKSVKEW